MSAMVSEGRQRLMKGIRGACTYSVKGCGCCYAGVLVHSVLETVLGQVDRPGDRIGPAIRATHYEPASGSWGVRISESSTGIECRWHVTGCSSQGTSPSFTFGATTQLLGTQLLLMDKQQMTLTDGSLVNKI